MREATWFFLVASIFGLICNIVSQCDFDRVDYRGVPDWTYQQIIEEERRLDAEVQKEPYSSAHYLETIYDIQDLEHVVGKFASNELNLDPRYGSATQSIRVGLQAMYNDFGNHYNQYLRTHIEEFSSLSGEFEKRRSKSLPRFPINWHEILRAIALFQLVPIPFVLIIFAFRAQDEGSSVLAEFMTNPRVPVYGFFWEFGLFRYSAEGFRERFVRAVRFTCTALMFLISFGAIKAKAQRTGEKEHSSDGEPSLVISGDMRFVTKYLGLDGAIFHPAPVLQKSLTIAHKSGLYSNLWHSNSINGPDVNPNYGHETDLTVGYTNTVGTVSFDAGLTYFDVTPLFRGPQGDIFQPSLRISVPLAKETKLGDVRGYLWLRSIVPARDAPHDGTFVHLGVTQRKSLSRNRNWSVGTSAEVVRDPGAFGFQKAMVARGSVVLQRRLGRLTLDLPHVQMSTPVTPTNDGRTFEHAIGAGLSFSFAPQ